MRTPLRKCLGTHGGWRTADAFMRVSVPVSPRTIMRAGGAATWLEARGRGGSFRSRALPNPPAPSRGQELPFFFHLRGSVPTPSSLPAAAEPKGTSGAPCPCSSTTTGGAGPLEPLGVAKLLQLTGTMPIYHAGVQLNSTQLKKGGKKSS